MTRYLIRIRTTWEKITGGDESLRRMLDAKTVNVLQGRCPRYSKEDEYMLSLQEGDLFATVAQLDKQGLWTRIYEIEHIIPSLHTFLEDTKLLEPCAKIMKKLLPTTCKTTIQQEFSRLHNRQTTWVLQATETSFQEQEEGSSDTAQKAAYRQLWLHAFRHFPEMICQPLRKDRTRPKPAPPVLELVWWSTITTLALDCGFTDVDQTFSDQDKAIYTMAETFLQQVRPPQLYTGDIHGELDRMVQSLITNRKVVAGDTEMSNVGHVIGIKCGSDIASRCGVPFEKAFRKDQKALFLRHIDQSSRQGQQDCVDSFTVKRDIFHSFFGVANEPCTLGARILTRPHPSPPYSSHHPLEPVSEPHYPPEGINPFNSTRPPDLSSEEVDMVPAPDFPSQEVDMVPAPAAQALERPGDMHARHVSREQAIGIFRDYGAASESHQIVVLKHLADRDTFELRQFGRADVIGLGQLVQEGWNYLVPDTNRGKRVKMTTAQDFPKEGFILLTPQQNTKEIKDAIEEEEVDMDDI